MKKLQGFTLQELLIAFGIISVLIGAAIHTINPFDKGIKFVYANVLYNLDKALYNVIAYDIPAKFRFV